ncbi:hypothetical protein PCK1_002311 [Pneumocystis canis]|nr:hypothetical protein PCK1_002311 [Pneumocystis canis]
MESTSSTPLMLPERPSNDASTTHSPILRLDQLGPVVVNRDGTLARIENWESLTDLEKRRIERILVQRNRLRLEKLQKERNIFRNRKTHTQCRRCGRRSFHMQKSTCASCGYPANNWSIKAIRRRTTGTGRMRHLKHVYQRFKNGFLGTGETARKSRQPSTQMDKKMREWRFQLGCMMNTPC